MKAALSRFRSSEISPKVTREEAKVKEAKWAQRHSELEAKLHSLTRQRDSPGSPDDSNDSFSLESRKTKEFEDQIRILKSRNEHLEKTNKSLTLLLVEKDALVSRYMSEMLKLRSELERVSKQRQTKDSAGSFSSALEDFRGFPSEDDVLEEWPAAKTNAPVGKEAQFRASGNSSVFEFEDSRFSLNSWRQSRNSSEIRGVSKGRAGKEAKRGEELARTGTFGEDKQQSDAKRLEIEVERVREMLESAERELIMEKQERVLMREANEKLEKDCDCLRVANEDLRWKLETKPESRKISPKAASGASLIASLQGELTEARSLIATLQGEIEQIRNVENPFSPPQDPNTLQAIQQLSMIILSKDKSSMVDPQTKSLVQSVFGDNFSNLVNAYEQKVAKLEDEIKDVRDMHRAELLKHVKHLELFQDTVDFLLEIHRQAKEDDGDYLLEMLAGSQEKYEQLQGDVATAVTETKLMYEEQGVMSIRNSEYSSPVKKPSYMSANGELEQMKTKVSLLTSENVSLLQKTRLLQSRESDIDRLKKSLNEHKAEKRKLTSENDKLKQDLTQALSSNTSLTQSLQRLDYRLKTELEPEDFFAVMQSQAAVVEEILSQQQNQSEALEDFDENFEL